MDDSTFVGEHLRALLAEMDGLEIVGQALDVGEAEEGDYQTPSLKVVILDLQLAAPEAALPFSNICGDPNPKTLVVVLTNHANAYYRKKCLDRRR
ncbi:MAG: hypothetical protein MZV65_28340 [Chromatiales bacterium]|nr:hypothetical protein [Chromatiales bacterium]